MSPGWYLNGNTVRLASHLIFSLFTKFFLSNDFAGGFPFSHFYAIVQMISRFPAQPGGKGEERADMGEGARGPWAKTEHEILYHDTEWCRPCRDDRALFELLELEGFQAGLSWKLILERRAALRAAFADFEPAALAGWGEDEVEAALAAPGVIKNRSKARCAVTNARAFLAVAEEWGSFARYLWHWVDGVPVDHRLERPEDMPAEDDLSRRVSADLKKRGFRFVGPVIVYSYLQGAGLINDHLVTCPWHGEGL